MVFVKNINEKYERAKLEFSDNLKLFVLKKLGFLSEKKNMSKLEILEKIQGFVKNLFIGLKNVVYFGVVSFSSILINLTMYLYENYIKIKMNIIMMSEGLILSLKKVIVLSHEIINLILGIYWIIVFLILIIIIIGLIVILYTVVNITYKGLKYLNTLRKELFLLIETKININNDIKISSINEKFENKKLNNEEYKGLFWRDEIRERLKK